MHIVFANFSTLNLQRLILFNNAKVKKAIFEEWLFKDFKKKGRSNLVPPLFCSACWASCCLAHLLTITTQTLSVFMICMKKREIKDKWNREMEGLRENWSVVVVSSHVFPRDRVWWWCDTNQPYVLAQHLLSLWVFNTEKKGKYRHEPHSCPYLLLLAYFCHLPYIVLMFLPIKDASLQEDHF